MYDNTTGGYNSAFGYNASPTIQPGIPNTAVGTGALYRNGTGFTKYTAIGRYALYNGTDASNIVAIGNEAFYNYTGSEGTGQAIGSESGVQYNIRNLL